MQLNSCYFFSSRRRHFSPSCSSSFTLTRSCQWLPHYPALFSSRTPTLVSTAPGKTLPRCPPRTPPTAVWVRRALRLPRHVWERVSCPPTGSRASSSFPRLLTRNRWAELKHLWCFSSSSPFFCQSLNLYLSLSINYFLLLIVQWRFCICRLVQVLLIAGLSHVKKKLK